MAKKELKSLKKGDKVYIYQSDPSYGFEVRDPKSRRVKSVDYAHITLHKEVYVHYKEAFLTLEEWKRAKKKSLRGEIKKYKSLKDMYLSLVGQFEEEIRLRREEVEYM